MPKYPIYIRLKNELKRKIEEDILPPGTCLPPEKNLCQEYGISRPSVRKALAELEIEGFIFRKAGKGSYVKGDEIEDTRIITIGVDLDMEYNRAEWYTPKLFSGIRSACQEFNVRLCLVDPKKLTRMPPNYIDGLLCIINEGFGALETLAKNGIPVITVNRISSDPEIGYIAVNYRKESAKVVEYLLATGHTRIGTIVEDLYYSQSRYAGYIDAFQKFGAPVDESLALRVNDNTDIIDQLETFLKDQKPTAFYALKAPHLLQIYYASAKIGLKIPEDLSVICFDNTDIISRETGVNFSGVNMPLYQMGQRSIQYLISKIKQGNSYPVLHEIVSADLLIRDSCLNININNTATKNE